jgi:hypothetical protein
MNHVFVDFENVHRVDASASHLNFNFNIKVEKWKSTDEKENPPGRSRAGLKAGRKNNQAVAAGWAGLPK